MPTSGVLTTGRDIRLDLFRGLALWFIFVDHIPENRFSAFTLQALGFFDAAEVFIFLSGYTAALVYGRSLDRNGFVISTAQVYRRVWQLYVAHLFLFVVLSAIVSYVIGRFGSPIYAEELGVGDFLTEPHVALVRALTLEFQPTFLDILPLYIVLLAAFPMVLVALRRSTWLALVPSLCLYGAVYVFDLRFADLGGLGADAQVRPLHRQQVQPQHRIQRRNRGQLFARRNLLQRGDLFQHRQRHRRARRQARRHHRNREGQQSVAITIRDLPAQHGAKDVAGCEYRQGYRDGIQPHFVGGLQEGGEIDEIGRAHV